ncbi:hypothetical protein BG006_003470 [Podila minutissima]|uniref:AAA+ ATPase domain-containing protein n=1 Tax=Podila minutissima TaxID=64525 RepID=A0A9P5VN98_9FUNG|nr:hypothetical protein BG006_003470 [Podila minutissima]
MPITETVNQGLHGAANLGQGALNKGAGFFHDFRDFVTKGNAFDLAIAFIISTALTAVIKSFVDDLITPLIGLASNRNLDEMFLILRCGKQGSPCSYSTRGIAQADGAVYYALRRKAIIRDRPCPYCGKDVNGAAVRCAFCTSWFDQDARRKLDGDFAIGSALNMSTTTLGTSNGLLKEKESIEVLKDGRSAGVQQSMMNAQPQKMINIQPGNVTIGGLGEGEVDNVDHPRGVNPNGKATSVLESASVLSSLPFPTSAAAAAARSTPCHVRANVANNVTHATRPTVTRTHAIPDCLRRAAETNTLSLSTLHKAVATLEKSSKNDITIAHVDSLLARVKGCSSTRLTPRRTSGRTEGSSRQYSSFRFVNHRKLQKLEAEAIANPNNSEAQADFYKELLRIDDYQAIISRFESAKFANSEAALQYYAIALARTNQAEQIVPKILQRIQRQPIATESEALINSIGQGVRRANGSPYSATEALGVNGGAAVSEALGGAGNKGNPIYVVMDDSKTSKGYMLWRGLRWLGITVTYAFCILTFLSLIFENSGLLKPAPSQTEFEPSADNNVKFTDVQGVDESKQELEEVVEFLKDPNKYNKLGGKLPKGVLLTGPPGTGKTMLARAVAGEAGVPFFFMSGSEFDEMYVGVGARRVRELFAAARARAPSIVFIDELDAIGARRNPKDQTYMKQTLNQLLVELDGFSQTEGVIIIAATNFPELLDKALVRPGRFDRHVNVPLPDVRGRMQILKHHLKNINTSPNVDISVIARGTPGFSGADLANLINQAAIQASREGVTEVGIKQFEHAKDKILMGVERRSQVVTMESKKLTAYHEGGHALVALYTPGAMPLHKATIMPRGNALGVTVQLPDMDKDSFTRKEYMAQLDVAMGGRVAEEMIFGSDNVTSGCSSDIVHATRVAKMMVTHYGMSEKVGPVAHQEEDMAVLSTPTKQLIESETKSLIEAAQTRATLLLKTHKEELHRLAKALVEYETLTQEEIRRAIEGKPIVR